MARERNLRDSLLNTLESLLADEFDRFKHRLSYIDYDGRENIPRCQLEEANTRFKLVDLLCTFYCEDGNVNLNSRYTKLIIFNKYRHEKEREHEIMAVRRRHADIMSEQAHSSITMDTLFKPDEDGQMSQIIVLLGAAGTGKIMTARKIMLDWAGGRLYQEFDYVFYINGREMNLLTKQGNMADMILKHCPNNSGRIRHILENTEKLLFIIDGFDELRFSFDQPKDNLCSDPWEKKPVEIVLSSLFRKTVLSECYLIITTRPTALEELRQFLEYPRYFNKFFRDEKQATAAFNFVCENEILLTMCFVPIVCWIICTVLKQQMERGKDLAQTSKTLTEVYLLYLFSLVQSPSSSSKPHMQASLRRLWSLAVDGIWKQKILFEEVEIKKYGLDQVDSLQSECAYSFIPLTFQEFFAALFYVLEEDEETMKDSVIPNRDVKELLIHYGQSTSCLITVHFLFGLLNKNRMKDKDEKLGCKISHEIKPVLKTWVISSLPSNINQHYYLEKFYYLYEIQEENFVKNALEHLTNLETWEKIFTQMDQMVLSFCVKHYHQLESLLIHYCVFRFEDHEEEEFPSLPKWLCHCWHFAAVLRTDQSLTELDLGYNQYIGDSRCLTGCVSLMSGPESGLYSPLQNWRRLSHYTGASCGYLAAVLRTSQSLTELELRDNVSLGDSGVQLLLTFGFLFVFTCVLYVTCSPASVAGVCFLLQIFQTCCKRHLFNLGFGEGCFPEGCRGGLTILFCSLYISVSYRLPSCSLTTAFRGNLSSVLSTSQTLTELDLKNNTIRDSGIQLLCEGLKHPNCKLQKLGLEKCDFTAACCGELSSALSTSQTLTELDLRENKVEDSRVKVLCEGLTQPACNLQKLVLSKWHVTKETQTELAAVKKIKSDLVIET
uniref:NACHT, LRR and PYD domains-containing protein 3 n=1 Tax=Gopherus agassizii TaxID=38772 RepID=A0A452HK46_9SAUR